MSTAVDLFLGLDFISKLSKLCDFCITYSVLKLIRLRLCLHSLNLPRDWHLCCFICWVYQFFICFHQLVLLFLPGPQLSIHHKCSKGQFFQSTLMRHNSFHVMMTLQFYLVGAKDMMRLSDSNAFSKIFLADDVFETFIFM